MTRNQAEIERLKNEYSMRSVVELYGFKVDRGGFINCPFHKGDRTASMKIYPKSYYCYACGAYGDIFNFIQAIEGVTFKEAFEKLGGVEHKLTQKESSWVQRQKMKRQRKQEKIARLKQMYADACQEMQIFRRWCQLNEPPKDCKSFEEWGEGADAWIWGYIHLQGAEYQADEILKALKKVEDS